MSYHQVSDTAATHERLMGELTQRLVSISDARDSGEPASVTPQQSHCGAAGEPSGIVPPSSAVSVISCSCHQHDNLHVQVTIKCPCSRPSTAEAATQTEQSPVERQQPGCAVPTAEENLATKHCDRDRSPTPLFSADEFSPRRTPGERRRSVQEALAHVREVLFEVLRETPRAVATTTSTAGIFATMFPVQPAASRIPSPTKVPQESSPSQIQAPPDAPAVVEDTLDTTGDQTILDTVQDSLNPRMDARRYMVSDELCAIYDRIESRWAEVCENVRADLNSR
ncbi:hypothetical protein HPB52_004412 [Rhipicephalus sanguineus]|uniref:Uncharacterized protein n=1 Tax=Rhipicephalus sanguineus TaxID=34632 RepID=A0A9D4PQ32_RHISA|nr:hypothetical protein HPB52_004412 [Rhipicephalus sanguineus]